MSTDKQEPDRSFLHLFLEASRGFDSGQLDGGPAGSTREGNDEH